jgi:hypothetical protein
MIQKMSVFLLATALCAIVFAVPPQTNFQGKITNAAGVAINGTYSIEFRIWSALSGGSMLWNETHAGVAVTKGLFDVVLGETSPLTLSFGSQYWLEIVFNGEVLSPRVPFTSTFYSFRSALADSASDVLPGTIDWDELASAVQDSIRATVASDWVQTGSTPNRYKRPLFGASPNDNVRAYEQTAVLGLYGRAYQDASNYATGYVGYYGIVYGASSNFAGIYGNSGNGAANLAVAGRYDANKYGYIGSANYGVFGTSDAVAGSGVYGVATGTTGDNNGVRGEASGSNHNRGIVGIGTGGDQAYGIKGYATAADTVFGVYGSLGTISGIGYAIYGFYSGTNYGYLGAVDCGVRGNSFTTGSGVVGICGVPTYSAIDAGVSGYSETKYGVYGYSAGLDGNGVYGNGGSDGTGVLAIASGPFSESPSRMNAAVWGQNSRTTNTPVQIAFGVVGTAKADTNSTGTYGTVIGNTVRDAKGLLGIVHSTYNSFGCLALNDAITTTSGEALYGVYGKIMTTGDGAGVYGYSQSTTLSGGNPIAMGGRNSATDGIGIVGASNNLSVFSGCPATLPTGGVGVAGWAEKYAVAGWLSGFNDNSAAVYGWWGANVWGALGYYSTSLVGSDYASVYGYRGASSQWAGYFDGSVYARDSMIYKYSRIHTLRRISGGEGSLYPLVSGVSDVFCRGRGAIAPVADEIFIAFPPEFNESVEPSLPIDVTLTPIGGFAAIYIDNITDKGFTVKIDRSYGVEGEVKFVWSAFGSRWSPVETIEIEQPPVKSADKSPEPNFSAPAVIEK